MLVKLAIPKRIQKISAANTEWGWKKLSRKFKGFRIEGYVHARLDHFLKNASLKCELGYYKFHTIDKNKKAKYSGGEIEFIFKKGKKIVPIEVKATDNIGQVDTFALCNFLKAYPAAPFGVILYGGVPFIDKNNNLLF